MKDLFSVHNHFSHWKKDLRIPGFKRSSESYFSLESFIPVESPSINAGDVRKGKHELFNDGRVKALPCTVLGSGPVLSNGVHSNP
jgi:hypothetical protein